SPNANSAEARGGNAIKIIIAVIKEFQVKIGIRHMVTPGARKAMIVVMILTPPRIVPNPCKPNPNTHRSPPIPGECPAFDNGVYPNQPNDAAPLGVRNPDMAISEPNRKSQYDTALSRGRATSGAPTCRGTITSAKPINNGVA